MTIKSTSVALWVLIIINDWNTSSHFVEGTFQRIPTVVTYPQVEISTGKLRGSFGTSREGREFYQFLGVPYGDSPTGRLRFEMPRPVKKWDGVKRADKHRSPCLQLNLITSLISGREDCLFLNIFVPNVQSQPRSHEFQNVEGPVNGIAADDTNETDVQEVFVDLRQNATTSQKLLPVIVFVYGGFYMYGSAKRYGPQYFMDENVILLTFNYRVGALGFLNTGDGIIRGNMGLKDQVLVLQWIQQNIAYFGGDPNQVIFSGESAASSVHYHILSKMSTGLFHKAISQSGSAIRTWQLAYRPAEQAKRLAKMLNCSIVNSNEMINCLKNVDGALIVSTHYERTDLLSDPLGQFAPTLEIVDDADTFMTKHPLEVLKSGDFNHVPYLIGINSEEGLIYSARMKKHVVSAINNDWKNVAPILLNYNMNRTDVAARVANFYFGKKSHVDYWKNFANFTKMFSDRFYLAASRLSAQEHAKYAPTFTYYFTYRGEFTFYDIFVSAGTFPRVLELGYSVATNWVINRVFKRQRPKYGVCHADELVMLYNLGYLTKVRKRDPDFEMSREMVKAWVNFATNHQNLKFRNHAWLPINSEDESPLYMNLDIHNAGMIREPFTNRAKFWESIGIIL